MFYGSHTGKRNITYDMKISKLHLELQVTKEYQKNFKNFKETMASKQNIVERLKVDIL